MCSKLSELVNWQRTSPGFTGSTGRLLPSHSSTDICWTGDSRPFSGILAFGGKVSCFHLILTYRAQHWFTLTVFISICAGNFYLFGHSTCFLPFRVEVLQVEKVEHRNFLRRYIQRRKLYSFFQCHLFSVCLVTCFHLFCHDPAKVLGTGTEWIARHARTASRPWMIGVLYNGFYYLKKHCL